MNNCGRQRNHRSIVSCVIMCVGFSMIVRGAVSVATYDVDTHDRGHLYINIAVLVGGVLMAIVSAVLCAVFSYKYKKSCVATSLNPHGGCNRNTQGCNTNGGYSQPPPAHIQRLGGNNSYPPTGNPAYPPVQNSYPPPDQNPAFSNPAYLPDPPPYAPPGNDPVYPPPGGNLYGNNYGGAPPASVPPPSYDSVTTGEVKEKY